MKTDEFTLANYLNKIEEIGFNEYPEIIGGVNDKYFQDFLDSKDLSLELRIHLTSAIICRCVGINEGIYFPVDVNWLVTEFQKNHHASVADITRTDAINLAIDHIQSEDVFGKCIVGTAFMYTTLEFFSKYYIGFNPLIDRLDNNHEKIEQYQKVRFSEAIIKIKKSDFSLSKELCKIDKFFDKKLKIME